MRLRLLSPGEAQRAKYNLICTSHSSGFASKSKVKIQDSLRNNTVIIKKLKKNGCECVDLDEVWIRKYYIYE